MAHFKNGVDAPPKHAFFTFNARCKTCGLRDRIILAGEASNEHVEFRQFTFAIFDLLDNDCDIFIDAASFAKALFVAAPCELFGGSPIWLPIIGPDGVEIAGWLHLEIGILGIAVTIKSKSESANAGE